MADTVRRPVLLHAQRRGGRVHEATARRAAPRFARSTPLRQCGPYCSAEGRVQVYF